MNTNVELRCACGVVQGVVSEASPKTINRAVCYCDDCQAFARFLERDDLVNDRGGSDIVQIAPSRLRFTAGTDKLRSMRFSEEGLFRWYTDCCKTPAGNMLYSARSPFVGMHKRMFVLEGSALDGAVGTPLGSIQGKFAIGGCPPGVDEGAGLRFLLPCMKWLLGNVIAGRHKPSPYWTADKKPTVEPRIFSREERMKFYPQP
jgi:hypothetical protein